ncbi:MAG: hypothetical protein ACKOEO_03875, partial [Planctomycetaceae bacterium]
MRFHAGLLLLAVVLSPFVTSPLQAADKPKSRVLMLTQSAGFKHSSVSRPGDDKLAVSEVAMIQLG